jgi:ATP-dependent DNA helicase PIF1
MLLPANMSQIDKLTEEQLAAFLLIEEGHSLFITGPGGTGKSFLLKAIYDHIPDRTGKHVAVTAMTGCAALLLGRHAKTLHSWAGIGLARDSPTVLAATIKRSRKVLQRWLGVDILVIDEVSMMTPELLEKLDEVARLVRKESKPFGGIQVVFVGDFFQLPPVNKDREKDICFVFESPVWNQIVRKTVELTKIIRQQDPVFQKILNEARIGQLSDESLVILQKRIGLNWQALEIRPTLLYTRRAEVDNINERNLKALPSEKCVFRAETVFAPIDTTCGLTKNSPEVQRVIEKMDKDAQYMTELVLAKGAQVMLLTNIDHEIGLMNGSRGVVYDFDPSGAPIVKFKTGEPIVIKKASWESEEIKGVSRSQYPLRLAYAITIHKGQGSTLDSSLVDIGISTFEVGQAYVALSRVRSLDSLYIWEIEPTAFRAHPKIIKFYKGLNPTA